MNTEHQISALRVLAERTLADDTAYFLVDIRIKPVNNVKIFIDGDKGVSIEKCVSVNRKLYKLIEEEALFGENPFSLEVSSPGTDVPLALFRQYVKNQGRQVELILTDGSRKEGIMDQVFDDHIVLSETLGKGKSKSVKSQEISFNNIKETKVQVKF